jgi:hypothetical protein
MQSRLSGVPVPHNLGAPFPNDVPRRRIALTLDVVTGPLSFLALWFGTTALVNAVHINDGWSGTIVGSAPTALWLAVVLALAWRG